MCTASGFALNHFQPECGTSLRPSLLPPTSTLCSQTGHQEHHLKLRISQEIMCSLQLLLGHSRTKDSFHDPSAHRQKPTLPGRSMALRSLSPLLPLQSPLTLTLPLEQASLLWMSLGIFKIFQFFHLSEQLVRSFPVVYSGQWILSKLTCAISGWKLSDKWNTTISGQDDVGSKCQNRASISLVHWMTSLKSLPLPSSCLLWLILHLYGA